MRTETVTVSIGENVGPVDWEHPIAKGKPDAWRQAEVSPCDYRFNGREIIEICMYDGWPYWKPTPAVHFIGPLKCSEWAFFNSYGVSDASISKTPASSARCEDCPPPGYPTDETRCDPCPLREEVVS